MAALWSSCVISCRTQAVELHPFIPTSSTTFALQMFDFSSVRPKFELTSIYQWCDADISAVNNPDYWNIKEKSLQGLPWNLVGLAAILILFYFLIICCEIDRAVWLFAGVFSKNSRGRIWQPCSVMDWNVRSAYGERRGKARGTAKPELFFETPWKLGWWLNKAFSPPKVQQQQQKIWSENKSLFFFLAEYHHIFLVHFGWL